MREGLGTFALISYSRSCSVQREVVNAKCFLSVFSLIYLDCCDVWCTLHSSAAAISSSWKDRPDGWELLFRVCTIRGTIWLQMTKSEGFCPEIENAVKSHVLIVKNM